MLRTLQHKIHILYFNFVFKTLCKNVFFKCLKIYLNQINSPSTWMEDINVRLKRNYLYESVKLNVTGFIP